MHNQIYESKSFQQKSFYDKNDLGAFYAKNATNFKLWAPTADSVAILIYKSPDKNDLFKKEKLTIQKNGIWTIQMNQDLANYYYIYEIIIDGKINFIVDPYAKMVNKNGDRGVIIDLDKTNPIGWKTYKKPEFIFPTDAVIYELNLNEVLNTFKYKKKIYNKDENYMKQIDMLIDHLVNLGITHVNLVKNPVNARDYFPKYYNMNIHDSEIDDNKNHSKIKYFKKVIKAFHDANIRVVLDINYNYNLMSDNSDFSEVIPHYYTKENYKTASSELGEILVKRPMVQKYIIDLIEYLAIEYKIDGFRFLFMGVYNIETISRIRKVLNEVDPTILMYGDGLVLKNSKSNENYITKENIFQTLGVALFNDENTLIKQQKITSYEKKMYKNNDENIKFLITAACYHSQINLKKVQFSNEYWALNPTQTINYLNANIEHSFTTQIIKMYSDFEKCDELKFKKILLAFLLTIQGIPLLNAKNEFLNYYLNDIEEQNFLNYVKGLIELRKSHTSFRMIRSSDIAKNITFFETGFENVIAVNIKPKNNKDIWKNIAIIYNFSSENLDIDLPSKGVWNVVVNEKHAGIETLYSFVGDNINVKKFSVCIVYSNEIYDNYLYENIDKENAKILNTIIGISAIAIVHKIKRIKTKKNEKEKNKLD